MAGDVPAPVNHAAAAGRHDATVPTSYQWPGTSAPLRFRAHVERRNAEGHGAVEFEPTDSASAKALYIYRLVVHDKLNTPCPPRVVIQTLTGRPY